MLFEIKKVIKKGDYLYALVPDHPNATKNGYVLMHRVIMENPLGRLLEKDEIVHHLDENKHNNAIENLQVMDSREHNRMHSSTGRTLVELVCPFCGKTFSREPRAVQGKMSFCSRSCNGKYQRERNWKPKYAV